MSSDFELRTSDRSHTFDLSTHNLQETQAQGSSRSRWLPLKDQNKVLLACSSLQLPIWGFAMAYGIFQEHYMEHWTFDGSRNTVGVIGTTYNGVMYLAMPLLFALFTRRWAHLRRTSAIIGVVLSCSSFLVCSFSTHGWQLVLAQGVLAALGGALIYSPTTLSLSEHFSADNRAIAYGLVLSSKNITGTACPFLMQSLLDKVGFKGTMWIWTGIVAATSIACVWSMPMIPRSTELSLSNNAVEETHRPRAIPWSFLRHRTIYIYAVAIAVQSSGYGIPQTYLTTYAHDVAALSTTNSTLLITLFNIPGILSSTFFGYLSDNKRKPLSASTGTCFSAVSSALATFLLWGLAAGRGGESLALLILFAIIYGFFAGGYSATWGGVIKEMEMEASANNEAIDTGMVYGLLNGARGIGYVAGGLAGVQLLHSSGRKSPIATNGYASDYGALIIYTGLATACGGWSILFCCQNLLRRLRISISSF